MHLTDLSYRYLNGTAEYLTSASTSFHRISTFWYLLFYHLLDVLRMNSKSLYLLVYLATFSAFCQSEDEEDEDYPDEVNQKIAKLRLEGAQYLQKVMNQLQNDRVQVQTMEVSSLGNTFYTQRMHDTGSETENYVTPVYNISGPTPVPDYEAEIINKSPPPISLSKEELLALYEAALGKVSQLPILQTGSQPAEDLQQMPMNSPSGMSIGSGGVKPVMQGQMGSPVSGYYYYYFPITSFLKSTTKPQLTPPPQQNTTPPPQQLHATITMMESPNNKSMEPLFMAISGFIGMALMFLFSVLFVPKFGKIRSKNAQFKDTPDEIGNFALIVLEAMAGKDCSERLACEIARVFRGIKTNNKTLRVLEIILPPKLAQQISLIRKSAGKKAKCVYIPCKIKKPKPPPQKPQKPKTTPWKKKDTPHNLWMKHFEKGKWKTKQQQSNKQQQQQKKNNTSNRKPALKNTKKKEFT